VRPNGVTAQAFERDISCHERAPNTAKTRRGGLSMAWIRQDFPARWEPDGP
jgi:hypothetical protein